MKDYNTTKEIALNLLFKTFLTGIRNFKAVKPREWLEQKGLSYDTQPIGFNSGQFHHRKSEEFRKPYVDIGVLIPSSVAVKSPELRAFTCFSPYSIVFPLMDDQNRITNLYSIRIKVASERTAYLNEKGIYPGYPHPSTQRLYITLNILDASTLLQARILENRDSVMALHDGELMDQHLEAVGKLYELREIVIIDGTRNEVVRQLTNLSPGIRTVNLPEGQSLNDMWAKFGVDAFLKLFDESFSDPVKNASQDEGSPLKEIYKGRLEYPTDIGTFYVLGNISSDLSTLKSTISFETKETGVAHRNKMDLYERSHVISFIKLVCEAENINANQFESKLLMLTNRLERYREKNLGLDFPEKKRPTNLLPPEKEKEAITFLSGPNVIDRINQLIEASGIVGEENTRKMVFVIASTYKMLNPLHGLIQGTSGSGKTHLINAISELMPPEDVLNMTRVTSKSFYHFKENELIGKLVLIQDIDGLDEEAMFAFREMQSAGWVSSSTTKKDNLGNHQSILKQVNSSFASLVATTRAEIYLDNLSRSIVLGVDESEAQTLKIIESQNRKTAGLFDHASAIKAKDLLQNCMRVLKPYEVVNRYANQIRLPVKAKMQRRLNSQYQDMIKQITLLNQHQRKQDEKGRLITEVDDLVQATEIMFDSIMWKVDELDSSLRQFFERLKEYLSQGDKGQQSSFNTKEVRQAVNLGSSQVGHYIKQLKELEYIYVSEGSVNRGFGYKVAYWDDMDKIRQTVKTDLMKQITVLK